MEKPWDRRSGRQVRVLSRGLPLVSGPGCPAAEVTQLGRAPPRLRGALGAASSLPSRPGQRRCDLALCWNTRTQDACWARAPLGPNGPQPPSGFLPRCRH